MVDILPDSRCRERKGEIRSPLGSLVPTFCMNCGVRWGWGPANDEAFIGVLCDPCANSPVGVMLGRHTHVVPDEVFAQKVVEAQIEEFGFVLTPIGLAKQLDERHSTMSLIARDYKPGKGR